MDVIYFASARAFRAWLEKHHDSAPEVWVGFYKKGSGKAGITYFEAVDEALCFGWIDGILRRVDEASYAQRFTRRKPKSTWSAVNVKKVEALRMAGRMAPPGLAAFEARDPAGSGRYSYENRPATLPAAMLKRFKANRGAWRFFDAQGASYKRTATWWVVSAVKEDTRQRRLDQLIEASARGERPKPFQVEIGQKP